MAIINKDEVIAIDGPAASGKSTVAGYVSEKLRIPYINTGNMYRAVTWYALKKGIKKDNLNQDSLAELLLSFNLNYERSGENSFVLTENGSDIETLIRGHEVASLVSVVASIPSVRDWLVAKQRKLAKDGMMVMEGRDIGTVVFPDARYKFFLTASPEVRARRRLNQPGETVETATVASVAEDIARRDQMDMNRKIAPLKMADDAVLINTDHYSINEVVRQIVGLVENECH